MKTINTKWIRQKKLKESKSWKPDNKDVLKIFYWVTFDNKCFEAVDEVLFNTSKYIDINICISIY